MTSYISQQDLALVKKLSDIDYPNLTMSGRVLAEEKDEFDNLRSRLKSLSDFFKKRYDAEYGNFYSTNSSGNAVGRGGTLRKVWSGVSKGSENKQYSAQISFVINEIGSCLDVGFYFGRASSFGLSNEKRARLESELIEIGTLISSAINDDTNFRKRYYDLFELGFKAEIKNSIVSPEEWLVNAGKNPQYSSLTARVYPTSLGYIDLGEMDFFVSMLVPFMSAVPELITKKENHKKKTVKALSPEQRAKKAERLALIGLDGEKYVMKIEKEKLAANNILKIDYPCHKALTSDNEGYDILTCDLTGEELFIEVKTTTMTKQHPFSKFFYLSANEYAFYKSNKERYRLYRVWDIYGTPFIDEIDLEKVDIKSDVFKVMIKYY